MNIVNLDTFALAFPPLFTFNNKANVIHDKILYSIVLMSLISIIFRHLGTQNIFYI